MPAIKMEDVASQPEIAKELTEQFNDLTERVRDRAYELFEKRRGKHGTDLEDWLRAEAELLFPAKFEVIHEVGSYHVSMSLPGFAAQDLKIYTLQKWSYYQGKRTRLVL
ncbi:MAG TPA: DUF2934 domain-containing protein [Bryobacteraceae bacterium]|jgi:HSP20 family molecular chaperone IbpA